MPLDQRLVPVDRIARAVVVRHTDARETATYRLWTGFSTAGTGTEHFDLFNAAASSKVVRVLAIVPILKLDAAITGTLAIQLDLYRSTAIGTGGSAAGYNGTSAPNISPLDTDNAALSDITARLTPTGGATKAHLLGSFNVFPEETITAGYLTHTLNMAAQNSQGQALVLRGDQGVVVEQGAVASVGSVGFLVDFTVEDT